MSRDPINDPDYMEVRQKHLDTLDLDEDLDPHRLAEFRNATNWGLAATLAWIITRDIRFACRVDGADAGFGKTGRWLAIDRAWNKVVRREFGTIDQAWGNALAPEFTKGTIQAVAARSSYLKSSLRAPVLMHGTETGIIFPPANRHGLAEHCRLEDRGNENESLVVPLDYTTENSGEVWHQFRISSERVREIWEGSEPGALWKSDRAMAESNASPLEKARAVFDTFVKAWPQEKRDFPNKAEDLAWIRKAVPEVSSIGNTKLAALRREVLEANGHDQYSWLRQGPRSKRPSARS